MSDLDHLHNVKVRLITNISLLKKLSLELMTEITELGAKDNLTKEEEEWLENCKNNLTEVRKEYPELVNSLKKLEELEKQVLKIGNEVESVLVSFSNNRTIKEITIKFQKEDLNPPKKYSKKAY